MYKEQLQIVLDKINKIKQILLYHESEKYLLECAFELGDLTRVLIEAIDILEDEDASG